jgi:hypothetical protein
MSKATKKTQKKLLTRMQGLRNAKCASLEFAIPKFYPHWSIFHFQRPASKSKAAKPAAKKAKASGSRVKKSKAMVDDEDDED